MSPEDARQVAECLVDADLKGNHDHGARMVQGEVTLLREGIINPRPRMKVIQDTETTALLDADRALGHLSAVKAMDLALEKATAHNLGAVGVRNSLDFGSAAYYVERAVRQEMIGFATTNAHATMAMPGTLTAVVGNNPVAFGIPTGSGVPFVLDMALSEPLRTASFSSRS